MSNEPRWLTEARKYIGQREIKGKTNNNLIVSWWKKIKRSGIANDEVPWCAAFVGAMLEDAGIVSSRYESAVSYLSWGKPLSHPEVGCIVVFKREGGGHVGFVVGQTMDGGLLVLGGNQSDEVNIRKFARDRAVGYRWPLAVSVPMENLPIMADVGSSTSEA